MDEKPPLPPVAVLEITAIDDDGYAHAVPGEKRNPVSADTVIHVLPDKKPGRDLAPGMRVLARLNQTAADTYEARIIRKIGFATGGLKIFGVAVRRRDGTWQIESAERSNRAPHPLAPPDKKIPFANGDMLEAALTHDRKDRRGGKVARAIRNLGACDGPGAYATLAIAEFGIRHAFDEATLCEAATAAAGIPAIAPAREDLRTLPLITIDGADAKDFDDAVFATPLADNTHRLIVAIADVAHYVAPDSALDREAARRGNSVYLPGRVVPMLPEALSNGACSLVPQETRACLAVEIIIDADGRKKSHRFFRALMRSVARLTYAQMDAWQAGDKSACGDMDSAIMENLLGAHAALAKARRERGALELDLPERRIVFDAAGMPSGISKKSQTQSMRLIEDFMIAANVAAAETLGNANRLCVYRAHEPPPPDKMESLFELTRAVQLPFAKGQVVRPRHFNALLAEAAARDDEAARAMLHEAVLRCQSQADYRITNPGHFGLGLRHYAHFTSPIRRYADLMVHRALIAMLEDRADAMPPDTAAAIAMQISETERIATAAERRTTDRFAAYLAQPHRGAVLEARITAITSFGAFLELPIGGEGLLGWRSMPDDYYEADTMRGMVHGRHSGLTLRCGEVITVRIAEVAPIKGTVALDYVKGGSKGKPGKSGKPPRGMRRGRQAGRPRHAHRANRAHRPRRH